MKKIPTIESLRADGEEAVGHPETSDGAKRESSKRKRGRAQLSPSKQRQRRRYARERAVQALYQWDVGEASASEVLRYFNEQQDMSRADPEYFRAAVTGVTHDPEPLDALLVPQLDRGLEELDPVERAVLRLSVWELTQRLDTPRGVVINEAVEVAKRFGADQGHKFVNGVLDALGKQLRPDEPLSGQGPAIRTTTQPDTPSGTSPEE